MSDIIHLLPDSVANQIAAGEVIQRPASVIKELVENSVDAGASHIRIYIKDAGRTLIQVIDDGIGMSETDARMAFERHATSKISKADDLFTLATMGFRGEALPSICAISQLELRTKTADANLGTSLKINCSRIESQEPCVCEKGTNIMVRNIFCNLPARRKFLKSDNVELANIMREFERLALVNNHLHMSIDTGTKVIDLRPGTLKQRIADIWKNNLNLQLLPIDCDTSIVKITGFISRPEFARRRNPLQYLIVNGRNMRHPYFHKAILSCYQNLIASDTQPCYFLKFEVDPSTIDVNIHPTKNEIKFEQDSEIWSILSAAVKNALGKFSTVPSINFEDGFLPSNQDVDAPLRPPHEAINADYNPFRREQETAPKVGQSSYGKYDTNPVPRNWNKLYADFMGQVATDSKQSHTGDATNLFDGDADAKHSPICIQFAKKYLVTSSEKGLMLIDQHRAHVRILYEKFLDTKSHNDATQRLMFPIDFELDVSQQLTLEGLEDELCRLGLTVKHIEGTKWQITAVPPSLSDSDPVDVVMRILDSVCDDYANYGNEGTPAETILQKVALVMARSAAIQGGQILSEKEMEHIVSELFKCKSPNYTPNGNPIVSVIEESRVHSMFEGM